ncbi:MAG: hypothetical protein FJ284_08615 [Planctomycetes bacterium]|nr:hypothetical protein [Planctomycetota bacterium]
MALPTRLVQRMSRGTFPFARVRVVGLVIAVGLPAVDARADISLLSLDTFAATNEGWKIGGAGIQPTQVSQPGSDGQTGYLSHLSDGGTANGKWLMWNDGARWQGNYPSAGVTGISLAANVSAGSSPVSMRIAFDGPGGWFYSSPLSVGTGWNLYSFPLAQSGFTHVSASGGTASFGDTMAAVTRFEVLSGAGAVSYRAGGDIVQAGTSTNTILLDDISAVPEPASPVLATAGLAVGAAGLVRRWRRS